MRVKATNEGLLGHETSSGYIIDQFVPFVALPSVRALHRCIRVYNPLTGIACNAVVLDVGPHFVDDDSYVFNGTRPRAEWDIHTYGKQLNGAGIDLGYYVWHKLGMTDNTDVDWEFIDGAV